MFVGQSLDYVLHTVYPEIALKLATRAAAIIQVTTNGRKADVKCGGRDKLLLGGIRQPGRGKLSGWYECAKVIKSWTSRKRHGCLYFHSNGQNICVTGWMAWSIMKISVGLFHPKRNS
jgi:hypothetical protein